MSRIGRMPISIPSGVEIKIGDENVVTVKGKLGTLEQKFNKNMTIKVENNEVLVDSVMFRLIQISEHSNKLTEDFKLSNSSVPWKALKGMRNRIVHEYGDVELGVVYQTITEDIPLLCEMLEKII